MSQFTDEELLFAEGFHTCFRKALDGKASSICWNAIYLLEAEDWYKFCHNAVYGEGTFKERILSEDALPWGKPSRSLFRIGLEMLTDEEIESLRYWGLELGREDD